MEVNCGENKDWFLLLFFVMNFHFVVHTALSDLVCSFICEKAQCNVQSIGATWQLPSTYPPPAFCSFSFLLLCSLIVKGNSFSLITLGHVDLSL